MVLLFHTEVVFSIVLVRFKIFISYRISQHLLISWVGAGGIILKDGRYVMSISARSHFSQFLYLFFRLSKHNHDSWSKCLDQNCVVFELLRKLFMKFDKHIVYAHNNFFIAKQIKLPSKIKIENISIMQLTSLSDPYMFV